ncbi:hydrogenase maturation protein [Thiohalomonas denitrificans]|uniref:Putative two-component system protein, hydrogenase maturation factor HypX/HoxX n=1 Tax=Thiohalomonas denitrificans TaxID=415747 RepID=A0A1G5QHD5_9GAMM|nr:hydrogenase maturation protein [Thiohalomonas denitrificans]SCZ61038.1 putative two-component system protein, hydrogenase maturation factor HypX/HoxX [Thiohalomonas denitrificans]
MRILFLTHSFNSLSQRLYVELSRDGHDISIEFDINDAVTREAVALWRPDLIIAPFLKRAIPEDVWRAHTCFIVHPGPRGDRGPAALDWAVLNGESTWGVTVLQAEAEMDAGPVWASVEFPMREARKSSLYRNEVTDAAVSAVRRALGRFAAGDFTPEPPSGGGRWRPACRQADRGIDWLCDDTATVLRKIRSADGQPGIRDRIGGVPCYLYDARREPALSGPPGELLACRHGAICRATIDGAVWIGHLRPAGEGPDFKQPAASVLDETARTLPDPGGDAAGAEAIRYEEANGIGYLHFDFYNGAMGVAECERLLDAYRSACERDTRLLVLMGGPDFWSNGLDLNQIEAAESPADESWRNIEAINELAWAIITTEDRLTVSALQGNAAAGGVFLALAADQVLARSGVVLNPHYKSMGNLFGSEYWTYLLPRRVGEARAAELTQNRLPIGAPEALSLGLIDAHFGEDGVDFSAQVQTRSEALAASPAYGEMLEGKRRRRAADEAQKPLAAYRAEELKRMQLNFYGFDPSYHVARYHFVFKVPHSRTPFFLARHRIGGMGVPE